MLLCDRMLFLFCDIPEKRFFVLVFFPIPCCLFYCKPISLELFLNKFMCLEYLCANSIEFSMRWKRFDNDHCLLFFFCIFFHCAELFLSYCFSFEKITVWISKKELS